VSLAGGEVMASAIPHYVQRSTASNIPNCRGDTRPDKPRDVLSHEEARRTLPSPTTASRCLGECVSVGDRRTDARWRRGRTSLSDDWTAPSGGGRCLGLRPPKPWHHRRRCRLPAEDWPQVEQMNRSSVRRLPLTKTLTVEPFRGSPADRPTADPREFGGCVLE
jgi:hypothetical protein